MAGLHARRALLATALLVGTAAATRTTWNGCKCKTTWDMPDGFKCETGCCNPDQDEVGEWCMVEDFDCEEVDWGYCRDAAFAEELVNCVDDPMGGQGWSDSEGETCKDYVDEMLCNANGGYGWGWDSEWGTFFDFAKDGKTAVDACCGCGGGIRAQGLANEEQCKNIEGWKDSDGDDCEAYKSSAWCNSTGFGAGWHEEWGNFTAFKNNGHTAFTACCACGGGVRDGSTALIARTTWNGCTCKKGWSDSLGNTCDGYCCNPDNDAQGEWCQVESVECEDFDWGYCRPLGALVPQGSACADDPPGWADSEGDTCDDYDSQQYCNDFGGYGPGWEVAWGTFHNFMNQQRTAATACCKCGGGHSVWSPHLAETCHNAADWKDKDGDDCAAYKTMAWCTESGVGPGWHEEWGALESFGVDGVSAKEACCHCGGGMRTRNFNQMLEHGREQATQIVTETVKEKPWVLPAGGVTFLLIIACCCVSCCCIFRKRKTREQAVDKAKHVAEKVVDAVAQPKKDARYNFVDDD